MKLLDADYYNADGIEYKKFLSKTIENTELSTEEKEKVIIDVFEKREKEFNLNSKKIICNIIIGLFLACYIILICTLYKVFLYEKELINIGKLNAVDRSINSNVIIALITGTVAQTAAAFVVLAKHLFPSTYNKKQKVL